MANYWIKLYTEILDDPKMATLPDRLWRRVIEIFLCAGRLGKNGELPETAQLAWMLRMSIDELEMDLIQIAATGMLERNESGWYVTKFASRQAKVTDAERQRQRRDRMKQHQYYGDVTDASRNVRQINRLTESDTDTEAEAERAPSSASDAVRIFGDVTGMVAIPGREDDRGYAIETILQISILQGRNTKDYLTHYYQAWLQRGYSKINPHWLDWAIAGKIPPKKQKLDKEKSLDELLTDAGYTNAGYK